MPTPDDADATTVPRGRPDGYFLLVQQQADGADGAGDLTAWLEIAVRRWRTLAVCGFVGAVALAAASFLISPVYKAEVVLVPAASDSSGGALAGIRSQFGGLASMAGIDLGEGAGGRRVEGIATLSSSAFARSFIEQQKLLPLLFPDRWDPSVGRWKDDVKVPTVADGAKVLKLRRFVAEDPKSTLVTLRVEWSDATVAADWANQMIAMLNSRMREQAIRSADRTIEFLNREIARTEDIALREVLYRSVQSQINAKAMAAIQPDFAFRVVDPAVPDTQKIRPKRAFMALGGALLGAFLSFIVVAVATRRQRPAQLSMTAPEESRG